MIILGKDIQAKYIKTLQKKVAKMEHKPVLVIIQIGENPASTLYINQKRKLGELLGVTVECYQLESNVTFDFIQKLIGDFNYDDDITGIIVQLPLPKKLQKYQLQIIDLIDPQKDVDGLTSINLKKLMSNQEGIVPATARGILTMLQDSNIEVKGKHVVVIGRSVLVGRSLAQLLLNKDATVTICHSKTKDLVLITKSADIIITATGQPGLITKYHVSKNQTVIDVGITQVGEALSGDVDFGSVSKIVKHISPVPGGVGPMTVLSIFQNLIENRVS